VADEHGKPLSGELAPSPAPTSPPAAADPAAACVACRGWHGGVGTELLCLRTTVEWQRRKLERQTDAIADLRERSDRLAENLTSRERTLAAQSSEIDSLRAQMFAATKEGTR
jgi:hypothetical protein